MMKISLERDTTQILIINKYSSICRREKSCYELHNRGFTRSRWPDESCFLATSKHNIHIFNRRFFIFTVGKSYISELNFSFSKFEFLPLLILYKRRESINELPSLLKLDKIREKFIHEIREIMNSPMKSSKKSKYSECVWKES